MMVLVAYDISVQDSAGAKRLQKIAKVCLDYGIRVQNSVFECEVDPVQWANLEATLLKLYDKKRDSLRFYKLGSKWKSRVTHYGVKQVQDIFRDALIL